MNDDRCPVCLQDDDDCDCDPLREVADEIKSVLVQLDELAETWGDEGVFRRCRDRLRAVAKKAEQWPR